MPLLLASAICYIAATLVMTRWDAIGTIRAAALVTASLAAAVLLETEALRQARLGYVFILILGFEASLALLCGWILFREAYAPLEILGLLLIIVGVAMTRLAAQVAAVH